ncbi:hypothetical protein ANABIO32_17410 [Rossellomorea marisflavi]|nr:hypothetical protein ANABIO32_17410 [Rossellomorea marisflavi]
MTDRQPTALDRGMDTGKDRDKDKRAQGQGRVLVMQLPQRQDR